MHKSEINILLLLLILAAGCSTEKNRSKFVFDTTMENIYWSPSPSTIKYDNAHSGNYACKINTTNAFSTVFESKVSEISNKPLKSAKISAWMMLTGDNSEQNLVLEIRDSSNQQTKEWLNTDAIDYIDNLNHWTKIDLIIDLTINDRNNLQNIYKVYASNGKEDAVFVDDFQVEFE